MLKHGTQRITHLGCEHLSLQTKTNAAHLSLGFECLKQAEGRKTILQAHRTILELSKPELSLPINQQKLTQWKQIAANVKNTSFSLLAAECIYKAYSELPMGPLKDCQSISHPNAWFCSGDPKKRPSPPLALHVSTLRALHVAGI